MVNSLADLNSLTREEAQKELLKCCGSGVWAKRLAAHHPYANIDQVLEQSETIWWSLAPDDWLEAFRSHPKIGEQKAEVATTKAAEKWAEQEQSGTHNAQEEVLAELAELNLRYEERFGFIFIVCATGKTASEILSLLRQRINNHPDEELRIAAAEQAKITALRILKLLKS